VTTTLHGGVERKASSVSPASARGPHPAQLASAVHGGRAAPVRSSFRREPTFAAYRPTAMKKTC